MSQVFALEWDSHEIRVVVASGRDRQVAIEHAFSVACESDASATGTEVRIEERIGRLIAAEMAARRLAPSDAVVAVGRNSIELRQLQLPPAADEDLPDLVRFQAMREFNEFDDSWLLDFVPIEGSAETPRTVLATALAPAVLAQCDAVCAQAGLKMRRLLLRPCEAALLLRAEPVSRGQTALLVGLLEAEADLTAVVDGTPIYLRTARIGSDPPPAQTLIAEIRRTMAAISNQLGGRRIEAIVLWGPRSAHVELARAIETDLEIPVRELDPFHGVKLGPALAVSPPQHPGRFAPLVGMALAEMESRDHTIDFLHPRRRPEAPDPRWKWCAAAAVAAALLLAWFVYARVDHYLFAKRVDQLAQQSQSLDKPIQEAQRARVNAAEIAKWVDEDANWLDRFFAINQSFPPMASAMLGEASAASGQHGGEIVLKGWVAAPDDLARLAESLHAHGYKMNQKSSGDDNNAAPYTCCFEASVLSEEKKP